MSGISRSALTGVLKLHEKYNNNTIKHHHKVKSNTLSLRLKQAICLTQICFTHHYLERTRLSIGIKRLFSSKLLRKMVCSLLLSTGILANGE